MGFNSAFEGFKSPPSPSGCSVPLRGWGGGMKLSVVTAEKWAKNKGLEFISIPNE
jgi:hypothetical protein